MRALGGEHERFLEQIEERRSGVLSEHLKEGARREARGPDREDLVEPEGTMEQKGGASGEREADCRRDDPATPEAIPVVSQDVLS